MATFYVDTFVASTYDRENNLEATEKVKAQKEGERWSYEIN